MSTIEHPAKDNTPAQTWQQLVDARVSYAAEHGSMAEPSNSAGLCKIVALSAALWTAIGSVVALWIIL